MPSTPPPAGSKDWIDELERRTAWWLHVLRLSNWEVQAGFSRLCHNDEMDEKGWVDINEQHSMARITLVDPDDWADGWLPEKDWEKTLVHEILEILFDRFKPKKGSPHYVDAEVALNCITAALVTLARQGASEPSQPQPVPDLPENPWRAAFLKGERE